MVYMFEGADRISMAAIEEASCARKSIEGVTSVAKPSVVMASSGVLSSRREQYLVYASDLSLLLLSTHCHFYSRHVQ